MNPILYEMFIGKIDSGLWVFMGILIIAFAAFVGVACLIETIIKAVKKK